MTFVKISQESDTNTYQLIPSSLASYAPKMSITLSNELVLNVYIPRNYTQKFTLDGKTYENLNDLKESIAALDDGTEYYHISVFLPSTSAARDVKLRATVNHDELAADVSFTLSIPKYAQRIISDDGASTVEKTLARDTLAYIREAYNYVGFASHNTADEIARVNSLISAVIGDYISSPTLSGITKSTSLVRQVTVNLDARPTVRFYVNDTSLEFYSSGKKLNTVVGVDSVYGDYIELDVYAHALSETVEYTGGGSYHISDFVSGSESEPHGALVRAFARYVESAADYRKEYLLKHEN